MTSTARDKLNSQHIFGAVIVGAIFAALMGSPWMFIVISAALIASSIASGEIRLNPGRRR